MCNTGSVNGKDVARESTKSLASNIATRKRPNMEELAKHKQICYEAKYAMKTG